MQRSSAESLSEVFTILKNKNLVCHLILIVDNRGFLSVYGEKMKV